MNKKQALAQNWIDCSRPLGPSIAVWPGDRTFEVTQSKAPGFVLSSFSATCHVGTHVDAPLHIDASGKGVEDIPLARFIGPAEVVQIKNGATTVDRKSFAHGWAPQASRVLVRTNSHPLGAVIDASYVAIEPGFATWLFEHGVELIGIDTASVDRFDNEALEVHHELVNAGMTWIEGLWLGSVEPGMYDMIALPMPLVGVEAAPVRVVLRRSNTESMT